MAGKRKTGPEITAERLAAVDPWYWAYINKVKLQSGTYTTVGHEYQIEPMQSTSRVRVWKKGGQMGFTEIEVLRTLHGMIHNHYPKGVLYLFPSSDDVSDFSKARFNPLITDNQASIGRFVQSTDAANIKRIGSAMLYLRGARSTQMVEGLKRDASKLRSVPVDKVVFDERDLMEEAMVQMALVRMAHSTIKEEAYLSTPTIPDFGIDKMYEESDQKVWMIKCGKCGRECCLELDFPECVKYNREGKAYRSCVKCGAELSPADGKWVARYAGREMDGRWISQLNLMSVDPGDILKKFTNPPGGNPQEVYNSMLAMAYIAAENRLTVNDVYSCCGTHVVQQADNGPCGMGIDVQGRSLVCVVGKKIMGGKKKIVWFGEVPDFSDAVELGRRFNVTCCAVDAYPETRKARDFQTSAGFPVFMCIYRDKVTAGGKINEELRIVDLARTEYCDMTHWEVIRGNYIFPRRNPHVEDFARQLSNIAKVLEEDEKRGTKIYRYRKLGPDHYRHALNYFEVAIKTLPESVDNPLRHMLNQLASAKSSYNPLTFHAGRS